jgi:hypothetical protein
MEARSYWLLIANIYSLAGWIFSTPLIWLVITGIFGVPDFRVHGLIGRFWKAQNPKIRLKMMPSKKIIPFESIADNANTLARVLNLP